MDEKSQLQVLDRTRASLPMTKGRPGTTTLSAALDVLTGKAIGRCLD